MLAVIVRLSLANPRVLTALGALMTVLGAASLANVRFDVFPDFAPPRVLVQTEAPGLDATQVESHVTRPLEGLLAGTENVQSVRSTSSQGLSAILVQFTRGGDPYRQRQVVTERLAESGSLLPEGVSSPSLSPLSSSMEYLVHFGFTSDRLTPLELRDLAQWTVRPQVLAVPGIAQAQILGGEVRERQIDADPVKLAAEGLSLQDVSEAARKATPQIGGGYMETPAQRLVVRTQMPYETIDDLSSAMITLRDGRPIRLGDVATIHDGAEPRFGDALIAGKPGILVETATQYGANTLDVTRALEQRLESLSGPLARQGVEYHPALLRPASFIESAIVSLRNSLIVGAALVVALLLVMLRDWRGALVSFAAIPLTLLTTVWVLQAAGFSLNTMTLGGLVVALGVVVDDAVIDVENILRRRRTLAGRRTGVLELFTSASLEVRLPVFYATAAVAVAFLPVLMMTGLQGSFFRPLSIAFLIAVCLSLLVAMSVTPALCTLTMAAHEPAAEARFLILLKRAQLRVIQWLHERSRVLYIVLILSGVTGLACLPLLGARFLPDFRENYLIVHAAVRPGISLRETARLGRAISQRLLAITGVKTVAEQIGRAENGQDPDAPHKSEFEVQIDPRRGGSPAQVESDIRRVFAQFPNVLIEINSVLAERIGETISGISAPFSVSVIGSDLDTDDRVGAKIVAVLQQLPHSGNVRLLIPPRQAELELTLRPDRLAFCGLRAADVLEAVGAVYHGRLAGELNQADRSVPVVVRLQADATDPRALNGLAVRCQDNALTPLSKVADVETVLTRPLIDHENGLRRQIVAASPLVRDQTGFAETARRAIARQVPLPPGVYLNYGGVAQAEQAAANELLNHSVAAFVMIVLLLALAFGGARQVLLVLCALPSTLIGGVIAVALTGGTLTLGAMVGFVALFGMAARNTILLVSHFDHLVREEGQPWNFQTALRGAEERLTPVLLTALLTALALLPVALQLHEPGHEIEGPMAIVILGGLVSSTLVSLLLIPPLATRWLKQPMIESGVARSPSAT